MKRVWIVLFVFLLIVGLSAGASFGHEATDGKGRTHSVGDSAAEGTAGEEPSKASQGGLDDACNRGNGTITRPGGNTDCPNPASGG